MRLNEFGYKKIMTSNMRCLLGKVNFFVVLQMVAKGKDCADLFPAVVKNVVSKDSEVAFLSLPLPLSLLLSLPPPPSLSLSHH